MADINLITLDREEASKLNPFIGSIFAGDSLFSLRQGLSFLQSINFADAQLNDSESRGIHLLCLTMDLALQYEIAQDCAERLAKRAPQAA